MRIWFQLVSSPDRLPNFCAAVREQVASVANPTTEVEVHGTTDGGLGDNYAALLHFDADEILRTAFREVRHGGYHVYALANSVDPGLEGLREILDIPVLSLMQVGCSVATMLGDKFGFVVPNFKFAPMYDQLPDRYGLRSKYVGSQPLGFSHIPDHDAMFVDDAAAEHGIEAVHAAAVSLVAQGAETILVPGPMGSLLHRHQVHESSGARIIDLYSTLLKVSEGMAYLAEHCGMSTSRRQKYQAPPADLLAEATRMYGL